MSFFLPAQGEEGQGAGLPTVREARFDHLVSPL